MQARLRSPRGFTIIEMLVVLAAMALLLSIAAPAYVRHVDRATEVTLQDSLRTVRQALDQFNADRGRYPQALAELVAAGYLRSVPVDPVTGRPDWVLVSDTAPSEAAPGVAEGVRDLHSASPRNSRSGVPYASY